MTCFWSVPLLIQVLQGENQHQPYDPSECEATAYETGTSVSGYGVYREVKNVLVRYAFRMPNGNPEISASEWARIKAFFTKHSVTLSDFAARHALAIDEYYHEAPAWSFRFQHPKGGGATVHVERLNDATIRLSGSWYVDEYETFTRYFKSGASQDVLLQQSELREALESCLTEIVGWDRKDLTPHPNYKKVWSIYSKEEWNKLFSPERLPALRM